MTSLEFSRWKYISRKYGLGFQSANWRAGLIASTVWNAGQRATKPLHPSDFYPPKK